MGFGFSDFYRIFSEMVGNNIRQYELVAWLINFDKGNEQVPMDRPGINHLVHSKPRSKEKYIEIKNRLESQNPTDLVNYFRAGIEGRYKIKTPPLVIEKFKKELNNDPDIPSETKTVLLKLANRDTMPEFLSSLFFFSFTGKELLIPDVLTKCIPSLLPNEHWLPRKNQEEQLKKILEDGSKEIYIIGEGGIGKTEFISTFANRNSSDYRFYFVTYKGSIRDTIIQLDFDGWKPEIVDPATGLVSIKPVEQQYKEKLHMLKKFDEKSVLIIDNFDGEAEFLLNEAEFKELKLLTLRLIFTTRMPLKNKTHIEISRFSSTELLQLMRSYVEDMYTDDELYSLIEAVGCHTLLVDLIARLLNESLLGTSPSTILAALTNGKWDTLKEKVSGTYNRNDSSKTVLNHLLSLFDVTTLSDDACYILSCATLLPLEGLNSPLFLNAVGKEEKWLDEVNSLRRTGWINFDCQSTQISIHPLLKEACLHSKKTTPGWMKNEKFISNIAQESFYPKSYKLALQLQAVLTQICITIELDNEYQDYVAEMYLMIGHLYNIIGNFQAAKEFIQMAMLFRQELPETHINMIRTISLLATVKQNLGEYSEARELFEEVISLRKKAHSSKEEPRLSPDYYNLCSVLSDMGCYPEALNCGLKSLELAYKNSDTTKSNLCRIFCLLSRIYAKLDNFAEQLNYAYRAFSYKEELTAEPLDKISVYSAYCWSLINNNRYEEALQYAEEMYKACKEEVPSQHPLVASAYRMLSLSYAGLTKEQDALKYANKELELYEIIFPFEHPDVGRCYYRKGNILFKMGKMPEALLAFKKAETILKQVLSPEHPDIINCIKTISKINSNNE